MVVPFLSLRTTNVELASKRRNSLKTTLFPLCRYLGEDTPVAYFEVMIHHQEQACADSWRVTVSVTTQRNRYRSVGQAEECAAALMAAKRELRQQLAVARQQVRQSRVRWLFRSPRLA